MTPLFQRLMDEAVALTHSGDLQAATHAIQLALAKSMGSPQAGPPPSSRQNPDRVVDVVAREVNDLEVLDAVELPLKAPQTPMAPRHTGSTPGEGRFIGGSHTDAHGTRDYKLYVPAAAATGEALPLVVMLHGCTQDPDDFARGTGMNDAARAQGFFVLYPAQSQGANAQRCWNWFKHSHQQRDRGEPALLAGMTRAVMKEHGIDPQRVYVAGLSAGGAMAAILGDTHPDLFAAVGVHSGLPAGAARDIGSAFAAMKGGPATFSAGTGLADLPGLARQPKAKGRPPRRRGSEPAVPTIVFHGDDDTTVHPINGEQVITACMPSTPAADAEVSHERARSRNGREYTRRSHRNAQGLVVAEHWVVHGAGHAWSGGRAKGSYTDATGPDATGEMLRFFFSHVKRAPR